MADEREVLVEVKNLEVTYGSGRKAYKAVKNANFTIYKGETFGLVGESGSGKTTIGRAIMRILPTSGGEVFYKGQKINGKISHALDKQVIKEIQMIFQDPFSSLDPRMSVSQLIAEPLIIYKKCSSRAALIQKVEELMDTVGLARRLVNTYPHELDGGRRQRIGVARALSLDPKFIVCDEPVSALDVSIQAQILNLMQDLQEQMGLTYIFITHDLSVVNHFANDIAVMYLGQLIEKAPSVTLFDNPVHPYTKALLSAIPVPSLRKKRQRVMLKGEISSPINPKPGCRFAVRCPYATDRCRTEEPKLVEIEKDHFVACHLTEK